MRLRGPFGDVTYRDESPDQPLLMVGIGTGLAPLWGVLREALAAGHRRAITLVHGGRVPQRLYLGEELHALRPHHPSLRVRRIVAESADPLSEQGDLASTVFPKGADWSGHRVYLCGDEAMVRALQRKAFLAGVDLDAIHADPFAMAAPLVTPAPGE